MRNADFPVGFSLIPDTVNTSPDYFCTWQAQLYCCNDGGPQAQRDCMTDAGLFGTQKGQGWAYQHPDARQDLIFLMDDSWDVPVGAQKDVSPDYGSLLLDGGKFPSCVLPGASPERAMTLLSNRIKALGWKGIGGWVCAQQAPRYAAQDPGEYWRERLERSEQAGWLYWKIDWGRECKNYYFRRMLIEMRHRYAPHLRVEQAMIPDLIPYADTFRTYDVFALLSVPCTLEKLNIDLRYDVTPGYGGIINCEDEVYIGAALGCAVHVVRHSMTGALPDGRPDSSFPDLHRRIKYRMDEVTRAVRWHRIAPAFPVNGRDTRISDARLEDTWHILDYRAEIEAWWKYRDGDTVVRSAPAAIARSLPLPLVEPDAENEIPYVVCSRHPDGAVSVCTLPRTRERRYFFPKSRVTLDASEKGSRPLPYDGVFGVFGEYAMLTIRTPWARPGKRVLAQDILGMEAVDITDRVILMDNTLILPGELIHTLGTAFGHAQDESDPGLAIKLL